MHTGRKGGWRAIRLDRPLKSLLGCATSTALPPDVDELEGRQVEVDAACRRPPIGVSDHADDDRLEEAPGGDVDFALPRATMGPSV